MFMEELGFYTLAGAPESPRALIDEVRQAEAMGLGTVFISERFNIKEACTLSGAAGAVSERIQHRHCRDEPQYPPPDGHGVLCDDDAPAHERAIQPGAWARHRADVQSLWPATDHDSPDGGLRRPHAAIVAR